jgi:hypothetical protein
MAAAQLSGRSVAAVLAAFAAAALGWLAAGWILQATDLGDLDLPTRAGGVFLALSLAEAAFSRFTGNG